jgi:hypothetical protein
MSLPVSTAEEVAIFAARRALATGAINRAFVETLHQLCQSDRAAIREHAVLLAHQAAAIEWTRRHGSAA